MENTLLHFSLWRQTAAIFYSSLFFILLSTRAVAEQPGDIDLALSDLTLIAVNETNFLYSFSLTNNGTSSQQGYSMKLTFSANQTLDGADYFSIIVPATNLAAQFIGPSQTLKKTEHFYAASKGQYLPSGTWYVFAEINDDKVIGESNYDNNLVSSTNQITVAPYVITFTTPPVVDKITESSFTLKATFSDPITTIYYKHQPNGMAAPDAEEIMSSNALFSWEPEVAIAGLGPAFQYDVFCVGESYDGNTTAVYKIDVTTTGTSDPIVVPLELEVELLPTAVNTMSAPMEFSLSGYHLSNSVSVTPSAKFLVSKDGTDYDDQISFGPSEFQNAAQVKVYVKSKAFESSGLKAGTIILESSGASMVTVNITIPIFDPTDIDFDGITSLDQSGWSTYSAEGFHNWTLIDLAKTSVNQRPNGEDWAMQIDGSLNGNTAEEDWLISPSVDLSHYTFHPTLKFSSYSSGSGEPLKLLYSSDYPGYGDPRNATWFDTEVEFPAVNSAKWKNSLIEITNREAEIHFAFIYKSTAVNGSRWTIDNWRITDALVEIPSMILSYEQVPVGTISESRELIIEVVGYGDLTVEASSGFQVSLDNITFASSVVVLENDLSVGKTIYVRFTPMVETDEFTGTLSFTATDLSITNEQLVGSTSTVTALEKNLSTSGFIYPNPTDGPVHLDLNAFETADMSVHVSVVNNLGSTVALFDGSLESIENKLSEVTVSMAPGLYYVTIKAAKGTYRNKLLRK
ncbi:MAG: choice-of-anchor J domain-containing protein [Chryseolinea sp.]